eukprot:TRINITY_DN1085_c1_g2_i1.p2 TRINITY_DN1085_c1_g2~~TRINITY_DN1085_c1_g2_i1.p2  ORF type:complete len:228 (-),score=-9.92 TRINITY_DN1085_c1_g2_i1:23-706(-)
MQTWRTSQLVKYSVIWIQSFRIQGFIGYNIQTERVPKLRFRLNFVRIQRIFEYNIQIFSVPRVDVISNFYCTTVIDIILNSTVLNVSACSFFDSILAKYLLQQDSLKKRQQNFDKRLEEKMKITYYKNILKINCKLIQSNLIYRKEKTTLVVMRCDKWDFQKLGISSCGKISLKSFLHQKLKKICYIKQFYFGKCKQYLEADWYQYNFSDLLNYCCNNCKKNQCQDM